MVPCTAGKLGVSTLGNLSSSVSRYSPWVWHATQASISLAAQGQHDLCPLMVALVLCNVCCGIQVVARYRLLTKCCSAPAILPKMRERHACRPWPLWREPTRHLHSAKPLDSWWRRQGTDTTPNLANQNIRRMSSALNNEF